MFIKSATVLMSQIKANLINLLLPHISLPLKYKLDKKRLVSRINPSLLLKIILYNSWTLQQIMLNQMKLFTKDN